MKQSKVTMAPAAQAELDALLAATTRFAQDKLAKNADFYPFGAKILSDGTLKMFNPNPPTADGLPRLDDMVALFRSAMRGKRDLLRAAALVEQVEVDGHQAIRVELEHRDGVALCVVQPYVRKHFTHAVKLGQPVTEAGTPHIWA